MKAYLAYSSITMAYTGFSGDNMLTFVK